MLNDAADADNAGNLLVKCLCTLASPNLAGDADNVDCSE